MGRGLRFPPRVSLLQGQPRTLGPQLFLGKKNPRTQTPIRKGKIRPGPITVAKHGFHIPRQGPRAMRGPTTRKGSGPGANLDSRGVLGGPIGGRYLAVQKAPHLNAKGFGNPGFKWSRVPPFPRFPRARGPGNKPRKKGLLGVPPGNHSSRVFAQEGGRGESQGARVKGPLFCPPLGGSGALCRGQLCLRGPPSGLAKRPHGSPESGPPQGTGGQKRGRGLRGKNPPGQRG